ncbi:MAG: peptidylprolyl isomerase [Bacillota bacterium]|nr:peptidylprolyl isomerase [Bacillota bacterium]
MSKTVAKIKDMEITQDDVVKFIEEIGPQVALQFQSEDGIKTIIKEMVNQELLLLDAKANNLDQEEEFKQVLEQTKETLLKNYAFTKVIGKVEVSDQEIQKVFEENKDLFAKDTIDASHILVASEEKAQEIKKEIQAGKAFEEAAKEYSTCPSKEAGGSLGEFGRGQMVKEFEEAAYALEEGQISDPVQTQFGYHLIRLNKKNSKDSTELKDVYMEVRAEALRLKQQQVYLEKIDQLNEVYKPEIIEENLKA